MSLNSYLNSQKDTFSYFTTLWPYILGFAIARTSIINTTYGAYRATDAGLATDGITLAVSFGFILVLLVNSTTRLPKRIVNNLQYFSLICISFGAIADGLINYYAGPSYAFNFMFNGWNMGFGFVTLFFWLRKLKNASEEITVQFVFSGLILSEVFIFIGSTLPTWLCFITTGIFVLGQFPLLMYTSNRPIKRRTDDNSSSLFDHFVKAENSSAYFLISLIVGFALFAICVGVLRGFPHGNSIALSHSSHIAYILVELCLAVVIVKSNSRKNSHTMTVAIWVILEVTACLGLIFYAAFPDTLEYGAIFATVTNALACGFMWFAICEFMTHGKADPYVYAIQWTLFYLIPRAIGRMIIMFVPQSSPALVAALCALLLIVAANLIQVQYLQSSNPERAQAASDSWLRGILKLDQSESGAATENLTREELLQFAMIELGETYQLTDREIQVATLYSLGHTQKSVAEMLFISEATVHTHMKNIYSKTNMHSRQELLDYVNTFQIETQ